MTKTAVFSTCCHTYVVSKCVARLVFENKWRDFRLSCDIAIYYVLSNCRQHGIELLGKKNVVMNTTLIRIYYHSQCRYEKAYV